MSHQVNVHFNSRAICTDAVSALEGDAFNIYSIQKKYLEKISELMKGI